MKTGQITAPVIAYETWEISTKPGTTASNFHRTLALCHAASSGTLPRVGGKTLGPGKPGMAVPRSVC